ncbi:MAG: glycosyltransferase 87 family protein [SAR324 cluster bacterium]|nr:glycosyltransferase 87 family protein [SAR324 cluster bacterium]
MDLINPITSARKFDPYIGGKMGTMPYFPIAYLFGGFYAKLPQFLWVPALFLAITTANLFLFKNNLTSTGKHQRTKFFYVSLLFILFFNYPVIFALDRGNLEVFIFCGFVTAYLNFSKRPLIADLSLAAVIAAKLYPGLFLLFYLKKQKYKRIVVVIGAVVFFELISLHIFKGPIVKNFTYQLEHQTAFHHNFNKGPRGVQFAHSLFGAAKTIAFIQKSKMDLNSMMTGYTIFALATAAIFTIILLRYPFEDWQILLLIFCLMSLLPFISYDYKLLHFLLPLSVFLRDAKERNGYNLLFAINFACILAPLGYTLKWIEPSLRSTHHISTLITPVNMLMMLSLIVLEVIKKKQRQNQKSPETLQV